MNQSGEGFGKMEAKLPPLPTTTIEKKKKRHWCKSGVSANLALNISFPEISSSLVCRLVFLSEMYSVVP